LLKAKNFIVKNFISAKILELPCLSGASVFPSSRHVMIFNQYTLRENVIFQQIIISWIEIK